MATSVATQHFLADTYGKQLKLSKNAISVDLGKGKYVSGVTCIAKHLQRTSEGYKNLSLEERMAVEQWLEYTAVEVHAAAGDGDKHTILLDLNHYLANKVYLVANTLTVADVLLYHSLHSIFNSNLTFQEKERYVHVSRWFNNVQQEASVRQLLPKVTFVRTLLYDGVGTH